VSSSFRSVPTSIIHISPAKANLSKNRLIRSVLSASPEHSIPLFSLPPLLEVGLYGVLENLLRKLLLVCSPAHTDLNIALVLQRQLHWLPVQRRVEFKIVCLVHQSFASTAPTYPTADIQPVSEHGRHHLRCSSNGTLLFHGAYQSR